MKLLKQSNASLTNSTLFCLLLLFSYFILPYLASYFLPATFYVFSPSQLLANSYIVQAFFPFAVFFLALLKANPWLKRVDCWPLLARKVLFLFFVVFMFQLLLIACVGTYYRIFVTSDREFMLEMLHVFLVSGSSYIFVAAFLYIATFPSRKIVVLISAVFIYVDLIYMGKKFIFYLMGMLLYRYDIRSFSGSVKPFVVTTFCGAFFVFVIFAVRHAIAESGSPLVIDVYSFFSEFIGVYASVGHAYDHHSFIDGWWNISSELASYYLPSVGHGLALHPVAYFVAVGGEYWFWYMLVYLALFAYVFYAFSMLIGGAAGLVLLVNIMHLMRHGPDIFLVQFFAQAGFIVAILYFPLALSSAKKAQLAHRGR